MKRSQPAAWNELLSGWEELAPASAWKIERQEIVVEDYIAFFPDQNGKVYLLKTMSSWAMSQNSTDAEITQALEGLKALNFNAVTVSPFGVHMNDSFGDRYKNKAGQHFFTDAPYASSFGPAWSSMDWIMSEATRLQLTVVFSLVTVHAPTRSLFGRRTLVSVR